MADIGLLDDYLDKRQLASQLKVSVRTLERWHRERFGPRRTVVGGKVLYAFEDLREWLVAQREDTPKRKRNAG